MAFDDDRTTAINEKKRAARSSCPQWSWIGSHRCCSDNLNFRSKQQPDNDLHISPLLFEFDGWTQVYRDRDQFASLVREVAAPDVGRMGIEILSFTIKGKQMGCVCHLTVRPSLQLCYWTRLLILCCTILCPKKDVYDDVEYLSSLGKAQTANVKRDAAVGVAQANRDAGIRVRIAIKHSIFNG